MVGKDVSCNGGALALTAPPCSKSARRLQLRTPYRSWAYSGWLREGAVSDPAPNGSGNAQLMGNFVSEIVLLRNPIMCRDYEYKHKKIGHQPLLVEL